MGTKGMAGGYFLRADEVSLINEASAVVKRAQRFANRDRIWLLVIKKPSQEDNPRGP
jgi:hypothetical protein